MLTPLSKKSNVLTMKVCHQLQDQDVFGKNFYKFLIVKEYFGIVMNFLIRYCHSFSFTSIKVNQPYWSQALYFGHISIKTECCYIMIINSYKQGCVISNNLIWIPTKSARSLVYIKKSKGPRTDPWGTLAIITPYDEHWPLNTTLCIL